MPRNEQTTEQALAMWRGGQTGAERMCAGLLILDDYQAMDPQAPLGGADGLKDILCRKNGRLHVAACYFPPTTVVFSKVKSKFVEDMGGVVKNDASGFVFLTNVRLTVGEQGQLQELASAAGVRLDLYHQERIRALLDSPRGFGLRLEYLGLSMTTEEQAALFAQMSGEMSMGLASTSDRLDVLMEEIWDLKETVLTKHDYPRRTMEEVSAAEQEFFDKVWYDRHQLTVSRVESGEAEIDPEIYKTARAAAAEKERKYGKENLGPWSDFEWGMLNGKLSAVRWFMGDEWDFLDT